MSAQEEKVGQSKSVVSESQYSPGNEFAATRDLNFLMIPYAKSSGDGSWKFVSEWNNNLYRYIWDQRANIDPQNPNNVPVINTIIGKYQLINDNLNALYQRRVKADQIDTFLDQLYANLGGFGGSLDKVSALTILRKINDFINANTLDGLR